MKVRRRAGDEYIQAVAEQSVASSLHSRLKFHRYSLPSIVTAPENLVVIVSRQRRAQMLPYYAADRPCQPADTPLCERAAIPYPYNVRMKTTSAAIATNSAAAWRDSVERSLVR